MVPSFFFAGIFLSYFSLDVCIREGRCIKWFNGRSLSSSVRKILCPFQDVQRWASYAEDCFFW